MSTPSIIFVTLADGMYSDHFDGPETLIWCGQNTGKRDSLVTEGTIVCVRANSKLRNFTVYGTVVSKEQLRAFNTTVEEKCALYKLILKVNAVPLVIERAAGDKFTHNTVLRHFGFAEDKSAMVQGIYGVTVSPATVS